MADAGALSLGKPAPSSSGTSDMNMILGRSLSSLDAATAKQQADAKKLEEETDKTLKGLESKQEAFDRIPRPKAPELLEPPKPQQTDPMQAFGSAATWLAVFGSLLTRRPLTNALSSATSVLNAFKENDAAAAKTAMESWRANLDHAKQLFEFQQNDYKTALETLQTDSKGAMDRLYLRAKVMGDENTAMLAQAGKFDEIYKMLDARERSVANMEAARARLETMYTKNEEERMRLEAIQKDLAANPPKSEAERIQRINAALHPTAATAGATMTPDAIDTMAQSIVATGNWALMDKLGGGTGAVPNRAAVENRVSQVMKERNVTPEMLAARSTELRARQTEASRVGLRAGNIAIAGVDTLKAVDAVEAFSAATPRAGLKTLNEYLNAAQTQVGDPNVVAFGGALNTLVNTYARLISQGSSTGGTVSDKDHAREMVNMGLSTGQVSAVLDVMRREVQFEQDAAEEALSSVGDKIRSASDPDKALHEAAARTEKGKRLNAFRKSLVDDPPTDPAGALARLDEFMVGTQTPSETRSPSQAVSGGEALPANPKSLVAGKLYKTPAGSGYWNPATQTFDPQPPGQ